MRNSRKKRIALRRAEMRRAFEEERDAVLAAIPDEYRAMFGQIGFTTWGKTVYPVLILNPYSLPNNNVRRQWLDMFEKLRDQQRLLSMSYAIYFYGADNPGVYYTFLEQKKFVSYDREVAKGPGKSVAKLPAKIQKKIDNGEALNKKEMEMQRCYEEMEEDLLKEPSERRRGVVDWLEDFELLEDDELDVGDDDDEEEYGSEVAEDDNFQLHNADDDDVPKVPTKKKKAGKTKIDKVRRKKKITPKSESPTDGNESEDPFAAKESVSHRVPKKDRKTTSSAQNKRPEEDRGGDIDSDAPENKPKELPPKTKKRGRPKKPPLQEEAPKEQEEWDADLDGEAAPVEPATKKKRGRPKNEQRAEEPPDQEKDWDADFDSEAAHVKPPKEKKRGRPKTALKENVSLKKKKQDREPTSIDVDEEEQRGDVKPPPASVKRAREMNVDSDGIGDVEESDMDEQDPDFDEVVAGDDAAATSENDNFEEEDMPSRKSKKGAKEQVVKKSQKVKYKEIRPQTDQRKKKVEKEALAFCEDNYLSIIEQWISAVQKRSVDLLRLVLTSVEEVIGEFSATFIFEYGIAVLMKETKSVLQDANAEAEIKMFTSVRKKVKESYNTKNAVVPKDYKPKLRRQDIAERAKKPFATTSAIALKDLDESQGSGPSNPDAKSIKLPKKESSTDPPPKVSDLPLVAAKTPANKVLGHQHSRPGAESTARPAAPVPKVKTFSLTDMLRPKQEPAMAAAASHNSSKGSATVLVDKKAPTPGIASGPAPWWRVSALEAPKEDPRALALEFFLQTAEHFETGTVDRDAFARALESAVYEWSQKNNQGSQWMTVYWDKVHALTAAICGKGVQGSLMKMIAQGHFTTPDKIASLSEDQLNMSFEGRPLDM